MNVIKQSDLDWATQDQDVSKVTQHFSSSSQSYKKVAQLQKQVGSTLLQYSEINKKDVVLDLGCGPGLFTKQLKEQSKKLVSFDIAKQMLLVNENDVLVQGNAHQLPFVDNSFDGVYSSLMIQWCDLNTVLGEIYRVLKPNRKAVVSTLVKGTLNELATAWSYVDQDEHIHRYLTDNDIEETCLEHKWQKFVVNKEVIELYYPTVNSLAKELKGLGANYVKGRVNKGLMPKSKWLNMVKHYKYNSFDEEKNAFLASYFVVYLELVK